MICDLMCSLLKSTLWIRSGTFPGVAYVLSSRIVSFGFFVCFSSDFGIIQTMLPEMNNCY